MSYDYPEKEHECSLFAPYSICKIRFENENSLETGLELILDGNYAVRGYEDDVYGLTSEEQLQLLLKKGVRFEILKQG